MAYFNHAFCKTFLGTKNASLGTSPNADQSAGTVGVASGYIFQNAGTYSTVNLVDGTVAGSNLGVGSYGFFDPKAWTGVDASSVSPCCPLVLAAAALYQKDGIGQPFSGGGAVGNFHGGYQESNKSKVINPKYVSQLYVVTPCTPNQSVVAIGATPYTFAQSLDCCKEFLCDQSYSLRIDIKGSPALRMLNHNAYYETATWTGCCPAGALAPVAVDPTEVYIAWATQLLTSPLINPFIQIIIYDQAGNAVGVANDTAAWETYVPQAVVPCVPGQATSGSGMVMVGAYVDTTFGNCTFYPTDFFEKQPVQLYASMVDHTGDVCDFTGICVTEQCCPRQGNGFGDTVLKDLILSERYQQNDFYTGTDLRIREITQGYDVSNAVNRAAFYTRYVIQHNVPRFNNPTGTFDNDQYQLEIITNGRDSNLEAMFTAWITSPICGTCDGLEIFACETACCPIPVSAPQGSDTVAGYTYFVGPVAGTAPFNFVVTAGALPGGLALNALTGEITGTPNAPGTFAMTIEATDTYGMVGGCFEIQIVITA